MAAIMGVTTLGASAAPAATVAAEAQPRDRWERREDRRDRREFRQDRREDRRDYRREMRQDRREYRQDVRQYERWQRAQRRYNAPRYYAPSGYAYRSWSYGDRMPYAYRDSRYVIHDYNRYGLRAPPRGYQYVRSGNDVVLAAVAGGLITAVIAGLFN